MSAPTCEQAGCTAPATRASGFPISLLCANHARAAVKESFR